MQRTRENKERDGQSVDLSPNTHLLLVLLGCANIIIIIYYTYTDALCIR